MISTAPPRSAAVPEPATDTAPHRPRAPRDGRARVVIENVTPIVDAGRFAVKRSVGEAVRVEADAFVDGHDKIAVAVRHRPVSAAADAPWHETDMAPLVNDRWAGEFDVFAQGWHEFHVAAWVDHFATWRYDFGKRVAAGQDVRVDLMIGADIVADAAASTDGEVARSLQGFAAFLRSELKDEAIEVALGSSLQTLMRRHAPRRFVTETGAPVRIWVDRPKARFSAWYELFPRSASSVPGKHGTLRDVEARLDRVAAMGFDTLYLPPVHPIGRQFRKGRNNSPVAEPGDVGSPWAIGGPEGGHDAIHPDLGTLADFDRLVRAAETRGIEVAMDLAFQCSPDHPYVKQHPEWFKHRP
ncbi:MAG TPA: maltotransferase domain-containing protein, partial [Humisphaera sp.]